MITGARTRPMSELEMAAIASELRGRTGASLAGCRFALQESGWDAAEALRFIRDRPWVKTVETVERGPLSPPAEARRFRIGDGVWRAGADAANGFEGVVVSKFHNSRGHARYVVEDNAGGLHIFSPEELTPRQSGAPDAVG